MARRITADKRFAFSSPKPTSWASFIRIPLSEMAMEKLNKVPKK